MMMMMMSDEIGKLSEAAQKCVSVALEHSLQRFTREKKKKKKKKCLNLAGLGLVDAHVREIVSQMSPARGNLGWVRSLHLSGNSIFSITNFATSRHS